MGAGLLKSEGVAHSPAVDCYVVLVVCRLQDAGIHLRIENVVKGVQDDFQDAMGTDVGIDLARLIAGCKFCFIGE